MDENKSILSEIERLKRISEEKSADFERQLEGLSKDAEMEKENVLKYTDNLLFYGDNQVRLCCRKFQLNKCYSVVIPIFYIIGQEKLVFFKSLHQRNAK